MNKIGLFFIAAILSNISLAQLSVDNTAPYDTPDNLVSNVLLGGGVTASNISWVSPDNIGYFDGNLANLGFDEGVYMSTGGGQLVATDGGAAFAPCWGSDINGTGNWNCPDFIDEPDLLLALANIGMNQFNVNNVTIMEFDFVAQSEEMSFQYVFGSNEYTSFTCSSFNDIFGFFLSGPGITGPYSNGAENLALVPGTNTPVGVNTINAGELVDDPDCNDIDPDFESYNVYWIDNDYIGAGWQGVNQPSAPENTVEGLTGFTTPLTAYYDGLQCGEIYHIKLAIADCSDGALNSAVFLDAGSFVSPSLEVTNNTGINSNYIEVDCGELVTLTAEPSEAGNYTFAWSTGETTESIEVGSGTYTVEVTSDANCAIFSEEIEVVVANSVLLDLGGDIVICDGLQTDINIVSLEGAEPYTYSWSSGESTESINVPAGTYTLDVVDANNCNAQDQVVVSYTARPTAELVGGGALCTGSPVGAPLNFSLTGAAPFLITYANENQQFTTTTQFLTTTEYLTSQGNYHIISIEDANCTGTYSGNALVVEYPLPTSYMEGGKIICPGDSVLVNVVVSGELPYDLYLNNGEYTVLHSQVATHTYPIYLYNPADYLITEIVDANGCHSIENDGSVSVLWKEPIDPQIITLVDSVLCPIDNPIQLEALRQGGVWKGNGLDYTGKFTPKNAGVGNHWITYSFPENCNETDSIAIEIGCSLQLFIPNTFTPNGNGDNEVWVIQGQNVLTFELQIFNRWGKEVFSTTEMTDYWTGDYMGKSVPTGTYSYLVKAYGKDAQFVTKTGLVNVIH